jgi:hypothetical protein
MTLHLKVAKQTFSDPIKSHPKMHSDLYKKIRVSDPFSKVCTVEEHPDTEISESVNVKSTTGDMK